MGRLGQAGVGEEGTDKKEGENDMNAKQILSVRKFKAGYEVREELIDGKEFGGDDFAMKSAYTPTGDYIGDPKRAYRLCKKRGIKPEKSSTDHNVCSIGFCETEQKWYGWSHRAMYGFGIGSKVKQGDCAFLPSNREEYIESLRQWYTDEMYHDLKMEVQNDGVHIFYDFIRDKPKKPRKRRISAISVETDGALYEIGCQGIALESKEGELPYFSPVAEIVGNKEIVHNHHVEPLDIDYGRGEWEAKTLEDAKQMAVDFAESVG